LKLPQKATQISYELDSMEGRGEEGKWVTGKER